MGDDQMLDVDTAAAYYADSQPKLVDLVRRSDHHELFFIHQINWVNYRRGCAMMT